MVAVTFLSALAGIDLIEVEPHIYCTEQPVDGGIYDRGAGLYDALIGNPFYNRLMWGIGVEAYRQAAITALAEASEGPAIDLGCGTLCFTAEAYRQFPDRPIVLVDRSIAMLRRARSRLSRSSTGFPPNITLVHSDFAGIGPHMRNFALAMSWGVYHVLPDNLDLVDVMTGCLSSDGTWAFSTLVTDRPWGAAYLRLLARAGEVARPNSMAEVCRNLDRHDLTYDIDLKGNMALFSGRLIQPKRGET